MTWLRKILGRGDAAPGTEAAAPPPPDWKARGNAALAAGDLAEAARCYEQGLQGTADAALHLNLGFVLLEQGQAAAAAARLREALAWAGPGDAFAHEVHYLLARAHRALGDTASALASLGDALAHRADFVPALQEGVALLQESGRHEEAFAWAQRWAQAEPGAAALLAFAQAAYLTGRHEESLAALQAVLAAQPGDAAALEGRAAVRLAQGHAELALADFDAALQAGGSGVNLLFGRANALGRLGRSQEALEALDRVLAVAPGHRDALADRSGLLLQRFRLDEAEATLNRALALYPDDEDLRWARATTRLLAGDLEGGWKDYEARHRASAAGVDFKVPDYGVPTWTGAEDLRGRSILVLAEQGLGDALQFVRYFPLLQERGARVTFNALPALHPLLRDAMPDVRLVQGGAIEKPDFQILIASLPMAFGTTLATVPARVPYLRSRGELRAAWQERLGPRRGLRVGVVWSGNPKFPGDGNRSMALETFRAIDTPGVEFVCLQKELRPTDRDALAAWPALSFHGDAIRDFADTAALADLVDVVVSTDTSVVHLCGALGRPTWVLLGQSPDWRWLLEREDCPWYPTARLFRQATWGDWGPVLRRVRGELEKLAATAPA